MIGLIFFSYAVILLIIKVNSLHFVELYSPYSNENKRFKITNIENCPVLRELDVLNYNECHEYCTTIIDNCIGFNFDNSTNSCVFFSSPRCLEHLEPLNNGSKGYLRD